MKIVHLLPEIDKALHNAAAPPRRKRVGVGRGAERGEQPNRAVVPRATIVAIRAAYEKEGLPLSQIERRYPEFSNSYLRQVISYTIRANTR